MSMAPATPDSPTTPLKMHPLTGAGTLGVSTLNFAFGCAQARYAVPLRPPRGFAALAAFTTAFGGRRFGNDGQPG